MSLKTFIVALVLVCGVYFLLSTIINTIKGRKAKKEKLEESEEKDNVSN